MTQMWINILLLASLPIIVVGWIKALGTARNARRRKFKDLPFPDEWIAYLTNNLPPYKKLKSETRQQLHGLMQVFLNEKSFEGCGGLEITDEIRITIAGQACILLLNRDTSFYSRLSTIIVYPSAYVAGKRGITGNQFDEESVRLGESWQSGIVVLSWDDVRRGAANFQDGHNVTFHEFAHQLDQEDGSADGAPILEHLSCYATWARVLTGEYKTLLRKKRRGKKTVMDKYGATNPAEFFAVATETFFEKPRQLLKKHPELYEELKSYYKVEPQEWE